MSKKKITFKELMSPRYYLPAFLKIRTKDAKLVPFVLNEAQDYVLRIIEKLKEQNKPVRLVILKARQMGISTFSEGYIFNDTATNKFKNSLIIAHEEQASQNLYQMYKTYYENLPPEITPMIKRSNAKELLFENPTPDVEEKRKNPGLCSKVQVSTANNVNTGRSSTIHNLHASEVAFWQDAKTVMTGLMNTIPDTPNTSIIIESTANGVGDWFYNFWKAAERGENNFVPIFLPWFTDKSYTRPFESKSEKEEFIREVNQVYKDMDGQDVHTEEYELMKEFNLTYEQLNWRKYTIQNKCNGDIEQFHQEYPSTPEEAFIATGRPRFSLTALKQYRKKQKEGTRGYLEWDNKELKTVRFVQDPKGYVEIFKMPEKGRFYCIGADVAEGLEEGDYSNAYVGSDDFMVYAKWRGHIDPDLYGEELVKLARFYNDAYLGVENNNHGLTTLKSIERLEYWNIYYTKTYDRIADKLTQKMGWTTNQRTKPLMIDKLAQFIREKWLYTTDKDFIDEAFTYVIDEKGRTNAQTGCHDDTIMSMAIMLMVILEGKGENYVPESPRELGEPKRELSFDTPHRYRHESHDEDEECKLEIAD